MNRLSSFALALSLSLSATAPALAIYPNPPPVRPLEVVIKTATDFRAAVKEVKADPVGPMADQLRKPMAEWVVETNDVSVDLCDEINPKSKLAPLDAVLFFEYLMDSALYQLDHPKASGRDAQVAGYQGIVELYASLKKRFPQDGVASAYADRLTEDFAQDGRKGLEKHTCAKPHAPVGEPTPQPSASS